MWQACAPAPPSAAEKERYLVEFANALRLHAPDGIPLAAARDFHSQHLFLLFGEWDKTWHLANNPRELIDNHGLAAGITYTRRGVTESSPGHVFIQLREFFEARRRSSAPSLGAVSLESVSESLGSLDGKHAHTRVLSERRDRPLCCPTANRLPPFLCSHVCVCFSHTAFNRPGARPDFQRARLQRPA